MPVAGLNVQRRLQIPDERTQEGIAFVRQALNALQDHLLQIPRQVGIVLAAALALRRCQFSFGQRSFKDTN